MSDISAPPELLIEASTNYFDSRAQAGQLLAQKLQKYCDQDTIVLALSENAIIVAAEIAKSIHSLITMLLTKDVYLPDGRTIVGVINELGGFVYNNSFSTGQIEELESEYRGNIEFAKMQAMHELHVALGQGGLISADYFRDRVVIVVTDGTIKGLVFDMANDYLKGIHTKKVIMATPIADVPALDRMHILADELYCLTAIDSVFGIDHYYADNTELNHQQIIDIINNIDTTWQRQDPIHLGNIPV